MPSQFEKFMAEASALPEEQRINLAQCLLASVPESKLSENHWAEEISRRIAELDSSKVQTVPYETAMAQIHSMLNGKVAK